MATQTCEDTCYTLEEGHVVLDFINTCYIRWDDDAPYGYEPVEEHLTGLPALAGWGAKIGLLDPDEAALLAEAELPGRLEDLRELREALRRVFRAHIHSQPVPEECLDAVNTAIRPVLRYTRIEPAPEGFRVRMDCGGPTGDPSLVLDRILWAVSQSAISLLTNNPKELAMVAECPGDDCGYLFRDTSHGRRRWCSMRSCGNRAKVQRFRERQREEAVA
jgi:predicted RNA-binding Zn ribbon-like protein